MEKSRKVGRWMDKVLQCRDIGKEQPLNKESFWTPFNKDVPIRINDERKDKHKA